MRLANAPRCLVVLTRQKTVPAMYRNQNLSILDVSIPLRPLLCDGTLHERSSLMRSIGSMALTPITSHRAICRTRLPVVCGHGSPHPAPRVGVGPDGELQPVVIVRLNFHQQLSRPISCMAHHVWSEMRARHLQSSLVMTPTILALTTATRSIVWLPISSHGHRQALVHTWRLQLYSICSQGAVDSIVSYQKLPGRQLDQVANPNLCPSL